MAEHRIRLGCVGVDSGQLMVMDPGCIDDLDADFYDEVCATTTDGVGGQLNYRLGHPGLAVAFSSGFGDGVYDVYATVRDFGALGERVARVEIELVPDEE